MQHSRTVQSEFTRQAESFAESPALGAAEVTERVGAALGDAPLGRVLDLACGPGVLIPVLAARARRMVGLDLTDRTLRLASQRATPRAAFVRGVAEQTPFPSASFDAAVLRLALHHFEAVDVALREARRVLRRGGRLVVLDLLTSEAVEVAALHNAIERIRDPSHVELISRPTLAAKIRSAGFRVVRDESWESRREYDDWARVIAEPARMASLELVLRHLARAGVETGMALREEPDGALAFTYAWGLFAADAC